MAVPVAPAADPPLAENTGLFGHFSVVRCQGQREERQMVCSQEVYCPVLAWGQTNILLWWRRTCYDDLIHRACTRFLCISGDFRYHLRDFKFLFPQDPQQTPTSPLTVISFFLLQGDNVKFYLIPVFLKTAKLKISPLPFVFWKRTYCKRPLCP